MNFTARRIAVASLLALFTILPLIEFFQIAGPPQNYASGDFPPGQSAYIMMRPAALIAVALLWFQLMVGTLGPALCRWLGVPTLLPLHQALGISAFALVLLHPVLFAWLRSLRSGKFEVMGTFIPPASENAWEYNLFFGAIGMYIIILAVIAATAGRKYFPRFWRYLHVFNYLAFVAVFIHALSVGSDTRLPMTNVIYWVMIATGAAATLYRVMSYFRSRGQGGEKLISLEASS